MSTVYSNKKGSIIFNIGEDDKKKKVKVSQGKNNIEKADLNKISKLEYFKALVMTGLIVVKEQEDLKEKILNAEVKKEEDRKEALKKKSEEDKKKSKENKKEKK